MIGDHSMLFANDAVEAVHHSAGVDSRLHLTVLYITLEGTLAGLQAAAVLAGDLNARIDLLTIQVVSHPLSFERPQVPIWFYSRLMDALASQAGLDEVTARVCLCRDRKQCLQQVLRPRSLVVMVEKKVEQWLASLGYQVVFVDVNHVPNLQRQSRMQTFLEMNGTV